MAQEMRRRAWRVVATGVAVGALVVSWPTGPSASAGMAGAGPRTLSAAVGNTFGGLTGQGQPMFVDLNSTRRKMVRAFATLEINCTTGPATFTDRFTGLPVTRSGKVRFVYGPVTQRHDDGTTTDYSGRFVGQLNDTRTRMTGVWRLALTDRDAAGTIVDTCDSGLVSWKAKN